MKSCLLLAALMLSFASFSQCAMCKATAENATNNADKGIGEGLNMGIIYLMGVPYLLLVTVALVFFRKKIWAFFNT